MSSNAINLDEHYGQDLQYSNCEIACTRATQQPVICGGICCDSTKCKKNKCTQPIKLQGCF
ncbi:hypothetical protein pb186bvf_006501 [Paramecium bursaria]